MTGTETMNQHTILATRLGDLTVVRNAEAVVGLYFPHHWYMPGPDTFGPAPTRDSTRSHGSSGNTWPAADGSSTCRSEPTAACRSVACGIW
jgi:hypothetical protein